MEVRSSTTKLARAGVDLNASNSSTSSLIPPFQFIACRKTPTSSQSSQATRRRRFLPLSRLEGPKKLT